MKKSDNPDVLFGRDFDEEASPIEELEGEVGQVVIRGKILTCELRELRSGNTLFMFSVTDFTDTIGVKIFAREDTLDDLKTKAGQFVRIKGVANIDKFDGELTIGSVSGIKKCEDFTSKRMDNSPVKRVELHCHTKMSDMDGVSEVKDIIKRAKQWGMDAIAVTDHGCVQAFPDANHAVDKGENFKILYGVEGYLVDDMKELAENEKGPTMRIVIKVGTSTLAHPTGRLNIQRIELLCKVMSDLKNAGHQIILVSSGAIAMGFGKLNLPERPKDVPTKQASAAVGQCELMYTYDKLFTEYNHTVAQLLITRPDITGGGQRRENFHVTLERLLELGALPIINENDTISTEEISIGDNDTLSAMVAASIRADLLILLSDIDGLYDSDPHKNPDARLIPVVERLDDHIRALAGGSGSSLGTGGMVTKLQAAQIATEAGCEMVIANGHHPAALYDIAAGQPVGTRFLAGRKDL